MKRTPRLTFRADPAIAAGQGGGDAAGVARGGGPATSSETSRVAGSVTSVSVSGLVVVDKEAGWTSHDVVARCRRIFGQRRVGHAGTLDPDATGVLLVGLGRATRLLRFLTALAKTYKAEIVLGTATSTLDASGEVTGGTCRRSPSSWSAAAAAALTGEIEQVPPMVSAVKVGGRRLHELARQGVEVERPPRPVTVYRLRHRPDPGRPGCTGPRSSARRAPTSGCWPPTWGRRSAAAPTCDHLRRTRIGSFGEAEMRPLDRSAPTPS